MSKVLPCLFAALVAAAGRCALAGVLAKADPPPPGFSSELEVQHATGSNEIRCYLRETEVDVDRPSCVAEVTNNVTLIFEGFWQDRETSVDVVEPGGQTRDYRAVNGAIFKFSMVPGRQIGRYKVTATQRGGRRVGSFVLKWASQPTVSVRSANVVAGDSAEYMLSGFEPEQRVAPFVYRANGITSYNGLGSAFFDFVTALEPVTTDARGEAILTIATDREDPTGQYVVITDPEAPPSAVATNQFWLAGGVRAPTPRRYTEEQSELADAPDAEMSGGRSEAAAGEPEQAQPAAVEQTPIESSLDPREGTITAEEAARLKSQLESALAHVDLSTERDAPGALRETDEPDAPATRPALAAGAGAETGERTTPVPPPSGPASTAADPPAETPSTIAATTADAGTDRCGEATVSGVSALSIRAEPSLSAEKVGFVSEGRSVRVLCDERVRNAGLVWVNVRNALGIKGWMSEKYLIATETHEAESAAIAVVESDTVPLPAQEPGIVEESTPHESTSSAGFAAEEGTNNDGHGTIETGCGYASVVNVASLAVRDAPSRDAKLIGSVALGETTVLLCVEPVDTPERITWVQIQTRSGLRGWMSARYMNLSDDLPD